MELLAQGVDAILPLLLALLPALLAQHPGGLPVSGDGGGLGGLQLAEDLVGLLRYLPK